MNVGFFDTSSSGFHKDTFLTFLHQAFNFENDVKSSKVWEKFLKETKEFGTNPNEKSKISPICVVASIKGLLSSNARSAEKRQSLKWTWLKTQMQLKRCRPSSLPATETSRD
jgi:hypothetical protein